MKSLYYDALDLITVQPQYTDHFRVQVRCILKILLNYMTSHHAIRNRPWFFSGKAFTRPCPGFFSGKEEFPNFDENPLLVIHHGYSAKFLKKMPNFDFNRMPSMEV